MMNINEAAPVCPCSCCTSPAFVVHVPLVSNMKIDYFMTRSYETPRTEPPPMAVRTFRLKFSRFVRKSSAASLFSGSDALGSRNKNCTRRSVMHGGA